MYDLLVMGSCRVGEFDNSDFSHNSHLTKSGVASPCTFTHNSSGLELLINPTGYSVSITEHIDLLEVFRGKIPPIEKENADIYNEIHKFSMNDLVIGHPYKSILLEVCSLKSIFVTENFKNQFKWGGQTIPYKVQSQALLDNYSDFIKDQKSLSYTDLHASISTFIERSGLNPCDIHILGPYFYRKDQGTEKALPSVVFEYRQEFDTNLKNLSTDLGFVYHNFSEILELDTAANSSLADRFHLSKFGVERLSKYVKNNILNVM